MADSKSSINAEHESAFSYPSLNWKSLVIKTSRIDQYYFETSGLFRFKQTKDNAHITFIQDNKETTICHVIDADNPLDSEEFAETCEDLSKLCDKDGYLKASECGIRLRLQDGKVIFTIKKGDSFEFERSIFQPNGIDGAMIKASSYKLRKIRHYVPYTMTLLGEELHCRLEIDVYQDNNLPESPVRLEVELPTAEHKAALDANPPEEFGKPTKQSNKYYAKNGFDNFGKW